jgi:RNA polymerase sigma factor (sigma-70 family)
VIAEVAWGTLLNAMGPYKAPQRPAPTPDTDDAAGLTGLVRLAAGGDPSATRQFLDAVWPTLARVVNGVLGARHPEADDVVQQALIAVVHALSAFRGECHPAGYASRITMHVALRARRNAAVRRARNESFAQSATPESDAAWPSDEVASERRKRALRDLLTELPEEQADALGLRIVLGWSLDEVAKASGVPVNTVRSRVRLAKEALRRRIAADPSLAADLELP